MSTIHKPAKMAMLSTQYGIISVFLLGVILGVALSSIHQSPTPPHVSPQNTLILYDAARTLQDKGNNQGAIAGYARLLVGDPAYLPALVAQAQCYQSLGLFAPALADMNLAVNNDPRNWNTLMLRASLDYAAGDDGQAFADAQNALRFAPRDANVLSRISTTFFELGDVKSAADILTQAIKINSSLYTLYWLRAGALATQNRLDDARRDYQTAARLSTGKNRLKMLQDLADWAFGNGESSLANHVYRVELTEARQYLNNHRSDSDVQAYASHASAQLKALAAQ